MRRRKMTRTKKIIITLLMTLMVASGLYATPWIQLGGIVDYGKAVSDEGFADGFKDISNYGFGAEARFNLFNWVSIDVPATFQFGDSISIATRPSVNMNIPVAPLLDLALGLGTELAFSDGDGGWTMNGLPMENGLDALKNSTLFYRGAVTFNLSFLSIGVAASIPMAGTFSSFDMTPQWDATRISASVLLNLL